MEKDKQPNKDNSGQESGVPRESGVPSRIRTASGRYVDANRLRSKLGTAFVHRGLSRKGH